ncbi:golgin subfamily A member 6-like protein 26 isoform X2 [Parasteatoda tepidariorum]
MFKKVNKTKESEVDEEEEEAEEEERLGKKNEHLRQKDVVSIRAGEIDNWKDLMELSKAYYVLEHPNSQSLTWKRRVTKKNYIDKFSDKDLIEWRVSQRFRLKSLEEWDRSREEERKLASKSSYNLDGLLDDQESRDLEDMFHILESKKQKKPKMTKLRKILMSERPFKFKDESLEDWTESYSEDSEGPGADEIEEDALDMSEKEDFQVGEIAEISKESEFDEESTISEIFSSYEEFHPYKNPDIEDDLKVETKKWKIKIPISN